jgi:hypothetical protein
MSPMQVKITRVEQSRRAEMAQLQSGACSRPHEPIEVEGGKPTVGPTHTNRSLRFPGRFRRQEMLEAEVRPIWDAAS